jgi:hypothetical protein
MSKKLIKQPSKNEKDEFRVPEDEDGCLSSKLSSLLMSRLEEYKKHNPESAETNLNALDFHAFIKKSPFEKLNLKKEKPLQVTSEPTSLAIEQNKKTFTQAAENKILTRVARLNTFQVVRSADNSLERSMSSESESPEHNASNVSCDISVIRKGILKTGTKSRFSQDKSFEVRKLVKSKKSSSFRLPNPTSTTPGGRLNKNESPSRKKTIIRR